MPDHAHIPAAAASIVEIRAAITDGRDPQSLVTPLWERAAALEPKLSAFAHLPERAPEAGEAGPLAGVAVAVKDLIDTADMPTGYGSPIYDGHRPEKDAEIVARLRDLGATVLGKTVTTEFAWRRAGPTRNPWNLDHTPGGSSSGSAAAVAAGIATLALGTQTFGSVIRPAAFCGVVGFKPSFGVLPRDGVHALSPSLDHVGLFARRVEDIAIAFPLLAGLDNAPRDAGGPLRIAALTPPDDLVSPAQADAFRGAGRRLADAGFAVETVEIANLPDRLQRAADTLVAYEAARSLEAEFERSPDLMSAVLTELVTAGLATSDAAYREAVGVQRQLRASVADAIAGFDAVLTVPAPGEAPRGLEHTGDARFCTPWTTLGFPAITLPVGLSPSGLPLGVQLVGRPGGDVDLLLVAARIARVLDVLDRTAELAPD
ncbi:amidase [Methylopila sp. M107]|uniref:amidase n=1 Tax=Methylopila sp. M107 TaxID=1101190 RepID=UPI000369E120|nr:amidase [Methylopila sp. M107]